MKKTFLLQSIVLLLLPLSFAAFAADVSGTFQVTISMTAPDGSVRKDVGLALLKQSGDVITGTIGPDQNRQNPIIEGTIKGDKVTLKIVPQPDLTMTFELTVRGDKLVGTYERTGLTNKAPVEFVKSDQK
jgi:hypothetical protein